MSTDPKDAGASAMTLDEYLSRYVEGYLFEDLKSMYAVRLGDGKIYGGVGYPMVATTLAGIELLGVLTSKTKFTGWHGNKRFRDYWQTFLYPGFPARRPLANAIYQLVRNGLAHTYTPKPAFIVTKEHNGRHMSWYNEFFWIDALTFADELIESYSQRVKPQLSAPSFKKRMDVRYTELRRKYREDYEKMKSILNKVPTTAQRMRASVPHSPSGVKIDHLTHGSTKSPFES